jgi:DNA-binding response OmpR family regulator
MQKHILIVDDEPAIRDMVAFALRKGEYEPPTPATPARRRPRSPTGCPT